MSLPVARCHIVPSEMVLYRAVRHFFVFQFDSNLHIPKLVRWLGGELGLLWASCEVLHAFFSQLSHELLNVNDVSTRQPS